LYLVLIGPGPLFGARAQLLSKTHLLGVEAVFERGSQESLDLLLVLGLEYIKLLSESASQGETKGTLTLLPVATELVGPRPA
jgi:hypothetical protein